MSLKGRACSTRSTTERQGASLLLAAALLCSLTACYQMRKGRPAATTDPARADGGLGGRSGGDGPTPGTMGEPEQPAGPYTCRPGSRCVVPDKPCIVGSTVCNGTEATCKETTTPQANGIPCGDGSVCLDGACSACQTGLECPIASNPCRMGIIDCSSGKAECTELGNAPNGMACKVGQAPGQAQANVCKEGTCAACTNGDPCVPANPCHEGTLACGGGGATCNDSGKNVPPGSSCGAGKVCDASGACVACLADMPCQLAEDPCKVGKLDCSTGAPVCRAAGDAPNGYGCGNGKVCSQGTCVACNTGSPCTPMNKCRLGTLACETGTPSCNESGMNAPNGTNCGNNLYCSNGACVPCTPNAACTTANPCKTGTTSCATGTSECRESGNAPSGRSCGNGMVCSDGTCAPCQGGMACQPSACKVGTTTCESGASKCMETGNAANNSPCGTGMLCNNGSCVSCQSLGRRLCGTTCVEGNCCNDGDCSGGFACVSNRCSTSQCRSGLLMCGTRCVDGNCCGDGDCGGACKVCTNNRCANAPNGPGPGCNTAASCSGGTARSADSCQNGSCQRGDTRSCSPFACSGTTCGSMCTGNTILRDGACVACGGANQPCCESNRCPAGTNLVCMGGTCRAQLPNGGSCSSGTQCQSGNCVNGTCCNNACSGACQECGSGTCRGTSGNSCGAGRECQSGNCVACGGSGQPCCSGGSCSSGACRSGRCCPGDQVGSGSGCACPSGTKSCGGSRCIPTNQCCDTCPGCQTCMNGTCRANQSRCFDGQQCIGSSCATCGDDGQPCCVVGEACFNIYRCHDGKTCTCKQATCASFGLTCGSFMDDCTKKEIVCGPPCTN